MSLADSQFMKNLLEGVKRKRESAIASRPGLEATSKQHNQAAKPN